MVVMEDGMESVRPRLKLTQSLISMVDMVLDTDMVVMEVGMENVRLTLMLRLTQSLISMVDMVLVMDMVLDTDMVVMEDGMENVRLTLMLRLTQSLISMVDMVLVMEVLDMEPHTGDKSIQYEEEGLHKDNRLNFLLPKIPAVNIISKIKQCEQDVFYLQHHQKYHEYVHSAD